MSSDFLRSPSASSTAFRVSCGEMIIDERYYVHSEILLAHVKEGSLRIETEKDSFSLNKGDIYFLAPNQKYRIVDNRYGSIDVILLNLSNPSSVTQEYIPNNIIRALTSGNCTQYAVISSYDSDYKMMLSNFECVMKAENEKPKFFQLLVHGKMYEIFYMLFSSGRVGIFDVEAQGKKYRAMRRVTEFINENYYEPITLELIAEKTGLSRYYISHLFKELMDTTFINYLNELRLNRAAMLLATTDVPVIQIAGMSGFNNISNFNRSFKMYYNITPSKYRKNAASQ